MQGPLYKEKAKRRRGPRKLPTNLNPLIRTLIRLIERHYNTDEDMEIESGVHKNCIRNWTRDTSPALPNFEAVLNAMGYRIAIVPFDHKPEREIKIDD